MKSGLLATVSVLALAAGAASLLRNRPRGGADTRQRGAGNRRRSEPEREAFRLMLSACGSSARDLSAGAGTETAEITRNFLLYFIVPLWFAAGIADWVCHRATDIENTGGAKESLLHLLMLAEVGIPVLAGFFLEITSPVIALMIAAFFIHEATALWDVSYAVTRREVTPIEQHVHSFLEMIPLMAISFIAVLHWPQFLALFGLGTERRDLSIRLKRAPLPASYVVPVLAAIVVLEWLPYTEELWRDIRRSGWRLTPPERP